MVTSNGGLIWLDDTAGVILFFLGLMFCVCVLAVKITLDMKLFTIFD